MKQHKKLPLIYSCSGASSAAQMANHIAVRLDRLEAAEMSCIAGVGGDVKPLVRTAKSGRPIIALDGCPLHCVAQTLKRHGLVADKHYDLSKMGVEKKHHEDFDPQDAGRLVERIRDDIKPAADAEAPSPDTPGCQPSQPSTGLPAADELCEPFSPPCYLNELKDW